MTVTDENWRHWRVNAVTVALRPPQIQYRVKGVGIESGSPIQMPNDLEANHHKATSLHVKCCLARCETAINSKHSKFKRRGQRPTSDAVLNYCQ